MVLFTAVASALAFTGSQAAAQKLIGNESKDKIKRHIKAMEALYKAQQEYAQKRAKNLDKIITRLAAEGTSKLRFDGYVAASRLFAEIVFQR